MIEKEFTDLIGQEVSSAGKEVIDTTCIRRYAQSIGDLNPLYLDEEYAKKTEYGGIIAPPTLLFDVTNDIFAEIGEDGRDLRRLSLSGLRGMRAGNEYQFIEPVRPGYVINQKRKIIDVYEKQSKTVGRMIFVVYDTFFTNQENKLLGISRESLMFIK